MDTAVIFYEAHRTSICQELLGHSGITFTAIRTATNLKRLHAALAELLNESPVVLIVGPAEGGQPECTLEICRILGVPTKGGRPDGVLRLSGQKNTKGYLIESLRQAIALLPDDPDSLGAMLPDLNRRLRDKFSLPAPEPELHLDYQNIVTNSMDQKEESL